MSRLSWYARRLGSMSVGEIAWRTGRAGFALVPAVERRALSDDRLFGAEHDWNRALEDFRSAAGRPALLDRERAVSVEAAHPVLAKSVIAAADRAAASRFAILGYPEATLATPPDWHFDPFAGYRWPSRAASRIDYRTAPGDPKWIWELNRLQHLPWLAQAWLFTGEDRYATTFFEHLDSWSLQHPPGKGIAWRGAFEAGIRAVSVAIALQGFRDSSLLTVHRYRRILRALAAAATMCWRDRSLYSSANNHLVGELVGLATVAIMFPELPRAARWEADALQALSEQAEVQILADGVGAEQSTAYQIFTVELLLVVAVLLRLRGDRVPPEILGAITRSSQFLGAAVGARDPDLRYGDDDGGFALRMGAEPVRSIRDHLGIVATVTGGDMRRFDANTTALSAWLSAAMPAGDRAEVASVPIRENWFASDGGLVVLRRGSRRAIVDVGPLGYLSLAAHGHADALSVTLSIDGHDVISDPGTGGYYGHPEWRAAHRGTRMHATVCVDSVDQSVIGGPFMWTSHANVRVRAVDLLRGIVDAEHDGYRRLEERVTHRRVLAAVPERDCPGRDLLMVVDVITGVGSHTVRTSWPLHPDLDVVRPVGMAAHTVSREGMPVLRIMHAATTDIACDEVRGDAASNLGWWSERLESRSPAWLVGGVCTGRLPVVLATLLDSTPGGESPIGGLAVALRGDIVVVRWSCGDVAGELRIDCTADGALVFGAG